MKQNLVAFILFSACLAGCKNDPKQVEIKGEIKGLTADTIYLYGNDELSDFIIPIHVEEGKFSLKMDMDTTLTQAALFIDHKKQYPVYLERGKTIRIRGDLDIPGSYEAEGSPVNEEFTAFYKMLPQPVNPNDTLSIRLVKEYIRQHQKSLINIYLLDRFFVQTSSPDFAGIKELIGLMDGSLQDKPYIERLTELIEQSETAEIGKTAPSFILTNAEDKRISRSEFRERYVLLSFWASWSDSCRRSNRELKKIYKKYPPKTQKVRDREKKREKDDRTYKRTPELAVVGISLDMDKTIWKETIKQDTLKWEQLNDFSGWNSTTVKQYGINELPYNILIDNRGKIIARGIKGKELNHKLDSLLKTK
jgi:peroxiredoxin